MPNYRIVLEVDEKWFQAIENFTDDVYDGELLRWVNVTEFEEYCEQCSNGTDQRCAECNAHYAATGEDLVNGN